MYLLADNTRITSQVALGQQRLSRSDNGTDQWEGTDLGFIFRFFHFDIKENGMRKGGETYERARLAAWAFEIASGGTAGNCAASAEICALVDNRHIERVY